jgi:hypothetical protein
VGSLVAAVEVIPAATGTQGVVDTSTRETAATPAELAAITADEVTLAIAATIEDIPEVAAIMVGAPIIMADVVTATLDTTAGAATMVVITQVARITESAVYSWDITGSLMGMPTSQAIAHRMATTTKSGTGTHSPAAMPVRMTTTSPRPNFIGEPDETRRCDWSANRPCTACSAWSPSILPTF